MGYKKVVQLFENLSIKKKVLYSTLVIFVFIGILSSIAYWIIFIPEITQQIQGHSLRVAQSLVTRCRTHILSSNRPELSAIVFQKKWIEKDISYIFVVDAGNKILAHTFIPQIPKEIENANLIESFEDKKIKLISVKGRSIYDAAVPVKEGLKTIGTVHIGVGKKPVDTLTLRMSIIFVSVMVIIILLASLLSNLVATFISRPLRSLTKAMNDLCIGKITRLPQFPERLKCWEVLECEEKRCPAFQNRDLVCWFVDGTLCPGQKEPSFPEKLEECYQCEVYEKLGGDEIIQLSHSFSNIIHTLQLNALETRRSEEKYRVLFHDSPNPLFVVDMKDATILDVNNTAIEIYQYRRDELMQMTFLDLIDIGDAKRFWKEVENSSHRDFFFLPKLWARKREGHHFFIDLHARMGQFHETEKGTTARSWIIRTVDITERLEQESQLIQAGKMATLGEMATGIAHELNQPLNVIKVGADFFTKMTQRGKQISEENLLKMSHNVSEQVDRATDIINHLRDFGRKSDFKQYPVDINKSIRDIFTLLGEQLRVRDIEVNLNLDKNLPNIMANKNPLEQIFLNLVTNARDAMESRGKDNQKKLSISTLQERGKVVARVSDTGTGIPRDIHEKIFEPFFTTKEVGKGTGLGLSITYNLVKNFEGEIELESTSESGTTFRVAFPIHRNEGYGYGETLTD